MSYSEKHAATPPCERCSEPAEKLVMAGKIPMWVCWSHFQDIKHGLTA